MAQKRWSLSVPLEGFTLAEHPAIAQEAERLGYTDAWSFEVDGIDCFSPLAILGATTNMRLGTAIANVYTRGPATLAQSAAGIAEIAPGRFHFGIGSGSQPIIEMWNHGKFDRPATRVREMAQFLRQALAGERVVFSGKTFCVDGFRLSRPPSEPIPIHVAALRENMLRVAGEVADGAIINWLSVEDVRKSVAIDIVTWLTVMAHKSAHTILTETARVVSGKIESPLRRAIEQDARFRILSRQLWQKIHNACNCICTVEC